MATTIGSYSNTFVPNKLTKPRVKPILKRLAQSEKNSLDLDRSWEEQRALDNNGYSHIWHTGWVGANDLSIAGGAGTIGPNGLGHGHGGAGGGSGGSGTGGAGGTGGSGIGGARTARDVTFSLGSDSSSPVSRKYVHHARSTSGASHHSHMSVATTASGPRGGTFVHPFQQTPRTSTPPLLSYATSLASFDNGQRDHSPTITEDDNNDGVDALSSNYPCPSSATALHSRSQSNLRRPSLASQTSSLSDITVPQPPRIHTATVPRPSTRSRLGQAGLASSRSDLNLNLALATAPIPSGGAKSLPSNNLLESASPLISPASTSTAARSSPALITATASASAITTPPTSSVSPMSPLRSSLEMATFPYARGYSEVSSAAHMDIVRHERRKFQEKESRKQERWDQKMVRKRDRDLTREAVKKEAEEAARVGRHSFGSTRRLAQSARSKSNPSLRASLGQLKKNRTTTSHPEWTSTKGPVSPLDDAASGDTEKSPSFPSFQRNYLRTAQPPGVPTVEEDVHSVAPPPGMRSNTAKAKTHGAWTSLILWVRTKLFRLSRSN